MRVVQAPRMVFTYELGDHQQAAEVAWVETPPKPHNYLRLTSVVINSPWRSLRPARFISMAFLTAILAGALVAVSSSLANAAPSNVVANSGFETGTLSGWSTWSNGNGDADYVEALGSRFGTYHGTH